MPSAFKQFFSSNSYANSSHYAAINRL